MGFIFEGRASDSSYIETVTQGYTAGDGLTTRPAEIHWHMVLVRHQGDTQLMVVGPLTTAGIVTYAEGVELLWIKFKLGTFMPHLPTRQRLDNQTALPGAASHSFWLKGAAWQFPDYENVETFVARLVREGALVHDPLVNAALQGESPSVARRTVRHRFLQATGLTQTHIEQVERAQRAATLLQQGIPILDTVEEAGYYDQPHLTRALKRWVGYTPVQIMRQATGDK